MTEISVVDNGNIRPAWVVEAVDSMIGKFSKKNMWEGIEFLVRVFAKKYPDQIKKYEKPLKNVHASNDDRDLRHIVSVPEALMDLIDAFYHDEIQNNRKKFYREFARRYQVFKVPEKI